MRPCQPKGNEFRSWALTVVGTGSAAAPSCAATPGSQHVGIQAVAQCDRCNRHARLHACFDRFGLEFRAVPPPPRRRNWVALFHRIHVSI